jgi:hypothetical protein
MEGDYRTTVWRAQRAVRKRIMIDSSQPTTAFIMKNCAILIALIMIIGRPAAADANELKQRPKDHPTTERAAKGLLNCTRECGLRHKDAGSRARCIGLAQASGKCGASR